METRPIDEDDGLLHELAWRVNNTKSPIGIHEWKKDLCVMLPWEQYELLIQPRHQIHIRTSEEGDWVEISVDGKVAYDGHEFAHCFLEDLLEPLGFTVTSEEIPGEDFL